MSANEGLVRRWMIWQVLAGLSGRINVDAVDLPSLPLDNFL